MNKNTGMLNKKYRYFTCDTWQKNITWAPIIRYEGDNDFGYFMHRNGKIIKSSHTLENLRSWNFGESKIREISAAEVALIL